MVLISAGTYLKAAQEAVVIAPVADLLGQSMKSFYKNQQKTALPNDKIENHYNTMKPVTQGEEICPRIYQLLFNERITILEEQGPEVKIKVPYALYGVGSQGKLAGTYWTLKKNLRTKDEIGQATFERVVPQSLNGNLTQQNTITLTTPFSHKASEKTFSAGTRFMIHHVSPQKNYVVSFYDPHYKKVALITIPHEICKENPTNQQQAQKEYVNLLRSWAKASTSQTTIPYVWGGASFTQDPQTKALGGFDCAGVIIRAAQSRSIPFFLKNSSAQKYHLDELNNQQLEEGDIMWIPGHVMIVSDLKRNTMIEARGHSSGYGRLHELPLNKLFKNINTFTDLLAAYRSKKPLEMIDKQGKTSTTITDYNLLKFSSVWKNHPKW